MKNHKSSREDKLEWLRKHPEMLDKPFYSIMRAMKDEDLISETTYALDIKLPSLVKQVQDEHTKKEHHRGH